jgi:hypothetical protein
MIHHRNITNSCVQLLQMTKLCLLSVLGSVALVTASSLNTSLATSSLLARSYPAMLDGAGALLCPDGVCRDGR